MIVSCHQELFEKFPTASVHVAVFDLVNNFDAKDGERWKETALESVRGSGITLEQLVEAPAIKEWRNAFQTFGVKPSKFRSSIEQLYRRALKGDIIQTSLPLVNLYCYVSLMQMVPMGGYDIQKIEGDIVLRLTGRDEKFVGIGEHQAMSCNPGIVVYSDDAGIICWAWNHRDSSRTCLTTESDKVIFFADSASAESRFRAAAAIDLLSEALSSAGAIKLGTCIVDRQTREATLEL